LIPSKKFSKKRHSCSSPAPNENFYPVKTNGTQSSALLSQKFRFYKKKSATARRSYWNFLKS
jgi:hypothetical protein